MDFGLMACGVRLKPFTSQNHLFRLLCCNIFLVDLCKERKTAVMNLHVRGLKKKKGGKI